MWCDDFDMDLPKVLPEAWALVTAMPEVRMWTFSDKTDGVINCPCAWNTHFGMASFFTLVPGKRPAEPFYVASYPVVECTWQQVVRDLWVHSHVCVVDDQPIWKPDARGFERLMYHVRGWHELSPLKLARTKENLIQNIRAACQGLQAVIADLELAKSPSLRKISEQVKTNDQTANR